MVQASDLGQTELGEAPPADSASSSSDLMRLDNAFGLGALLLPWWAFPVAGFFGVLDGGGAACWATSRLKMESGCGAVLLFFLFVLSFLVFRYVLRSF